MNSKSGCWMPKYRDHKSYTINIYNSDFTNLIATIKNIITKLGLNLNKIASSLTTSRQFYISIQAARVV